MAVREDNKVQYVDLMIAWRLSRGIKSQTDSLRLGLREMLPKEYLDTFDSQELEWVIAGTASINMDDWKRNTLYWGGEKGRGHKLSANFLCTWLVGVGGGLMIGAM